MSDEEAPITTKRGQVRELLRRRIDEQLHPGDALDSERELVAELGVSRVTVRQAIADLVKEGVLERSQGRGTFVTGPQVNSRLHLMSFSREMRSRGLEPRTEVLGAVVEPADDEVAGHLRIRRGEEVVRLERIRLADGTPMAHEVGWYPSALFPGMLQHRLTTVYDLIAEQYGLVATHGEQVVSAESADRDRAHILDTTRHAPLLVTERVTWAGEVPIEFSRSWYRADRYRIHSTIRPRADEH